MMARSVRASLGLAACISVHKAVGYSSPRIRIPLACVQDIAHLQQCKGELARWLSAYAAQGWHPPVVIDAQGALVISAPPHGAPVVPPAPPQAAAGGVDSCPVCRNGEQLVLPLAEVRRLEEDSLATQAHIQAQQRFIHRMRQELEGCRHD